MPQAPRRNDRIRVCPECGAAINHVCIRRSFSEVAYGYEWGTCNFEGEDVEIDNSETDDYDGYEPGDDVGYECPECRSSITLDALLTAEEAEENEVSVKKKEENNPNKLGNYERR